MAPKHAKHSKRTKKPPPTPPPIWNSDIAGSPTESDLTDFTTPRTRDYTNNNEARFDDVSTPGGHSVSIPVSIPSPATPTSDLTDAGTPKSMYAPTTRFTTSITGNLAHPRPVRRETVLTPNYNADAETDTGEKQEQQNKNEDHICTAAALFGAGTLLGALMNGFSLILGTILEGKRRRNYVLGCSLGAVLQISIIIVVLVYAVPMTGPAGVLYRTEAM